MLEERCEHCRYFRQRTLTSSDFGHCKRYPPQLLLVEREVGEFLPVMSSTDSCGEFSPRENPLTEGDS